MATPKSIHVSTSDSGVYGTRVRADSAKTASEVLQADMERHHVFFNEMHYHNHIVHHVLSLYVLGASPEDIKASYERDSSYQRPVLPVNDEAVKSLGGKDGFKAALGDEKNYPSFLAFFQQEISKRGMESVLKEYLFSRDECAESMMSRLFGGLVHPFIHLGFGIEFNQPAIVAEGLAQTAVHEDYIGRDFLIPAEKAAASTGKQDPTTMLQILEDIRADPKLVESVRWQDSNKIREGVLARGFDEMVKYASRFTVGKDQLEEKMAEAINVITYYTAAAQHQSKEIKFDFFFLHCITASIFLSSMLALPFLDVSSKVRLLEWKGRIDLLMYVSRGAPPLRLDEVTKYASTRSWDDIFAEVIANPHDDGHAIKLVRALAHGENVCRPFEAHAKEKGLPITGDMWLKIGNMVVDSISDPGLPMWVRSAGFNEAWTAFKDRARL